MKAIQTKYIGASNTKPARVKAYTMDQSITISWDQEIGRKQNHTQAALALCSKMRWEGTLAQGSISAGADVFVFVPNDASGVRCSTHVFRVHLAIKGADLMARRGFAVNQITFNECASCGKFHPAKYKGDCYPNPSMIFTPSDIDALRDAYPYIKIIAETPAN